MTDKLRMLHVGLAEGEIGEYVFLPGSPERAERISKFFDNPTKVAQNREHTTYTGYLDGVKVSVTSTGMGGPSATIALEELVKLGAHTFIRIGTCASTSAKVERGDIVLPNGAVRMEGTGLHYLPMEYPAVPDYFLLKKLEEATIELGYKYNVGVSITKDSFYTQNEPEAKPVGYELINKWNAYEKGGATSTEMESSPLFLAGGSLGVRTATVLVSATNYKNYGHDAKVYPTDSERRAIEVGILAMRKAIAEDQAKKSNE